MSGHCTVTSGSIDKLAHCIRGHLEYQYGIPPDDLRAHEWVILSTPEPTEIGGRRRILVEIEVRA